MKLVNGKWQESHKDWLRRKGLLPSQIKKRKTSNPNWKKEYTETLKVDRSTAHYDKKNFVAVHCPDRSIMSNIHKESPETKKAILEKAAKTAPLYSKGPYQLITNGTDLTDVGKKK